MSILTPLARPPIDGIAVGIAWAVQEVAMSRIVAAEYFILIWSEYCLVYWMVGEYWIKRGFVRKAAGSKLKSELGFTVFEMEMLLKELV